MMDKDSKLSSEEGLWLAQRLLQCRNARNKSGMCGLEGSTECENKFNTLFGVKTGFDNVDIKRTAMQRS